MLTFLHGVFDVLHVPQGLVRRPFAIQLGDFGLRWVLVDVVWATVGAIAIGVAGGTLIAHIGWKLRGLEEKHDVLDDLVGLGLIGVVAVLVPFGVPMGFVAILGILALIGILIRNSVILVHEIQELLHKGRSPWQAVFEASDSRARPILLTAAAASLALIPISRQVFWGPMAFSMMGGIIAGTLITLVFVPALYCAVMQVRPDPA